MKKKKLILQGVVEHIRTGVFNLTQYEDINNVMLFHDLDEAMSLEGIERLLSDLGCVDYPVKKVVGKVVAKEVPDKKGGPGGEGGDKGQGGGGNKKGGG